MSEIGSRANSGDGLLRLLRHVLVFGNLILIEEDVGFARGLAAKRLK